MAVVSISWVSAFKIGFSLLLLAAIATALVSFPVKTDLWPWGPLVLAFVYIPLTILAVPASVFTLGGGYLFGLSVGFIADLIGTTVAFILGRTIGRLYLISKLRNCPKFRAVASAIEISSFKLVLLLRFFPLLPFNLLNYLLSVTPIRLEAYVLASWLGMMPSTFGLAYVGTAIKDLSDVTHGWNKISTIHQIFMALGFSLSVILLVCITKVAKASLDNELIENAEMEKIFALSMLPIEPDSHSPLDVGKSLVIDSSMGENPRQVLV